MATVQGTVEGVSTKFDKFSIMVGGTWYATKQEWAPKPAPEKGDVVEFDNGGAKYIKRLKITGKDNGTNTGSGKASNNNYARGKFPIDPLDGQRSIIRQNALTNARELIAVFAVDGPDKSVDKIIDIARRFEAYTAGDLDRQQAEEMAKRMFDGEDD